MQRDPPPVPQRVYYYTLDDLRKHTTRLPPDWYTLHNNNEEITFAHIRDGVVKIHVTISASLTSYVKVYGMPAQHLSRDIEMVRLHDYLLALSSMKHCTGITNQKLHTFSKPPAGHSNQAHFLHTTLVCQEDKPVNETCVRSSNCCLLSESDVCQKCLQTQRALEKSEAELSSRDKCSLNKHDPLHTVSREKLKSAVKDLRKREACLRKELDKIKESIKTESVSVEPDMHSELNRVMTEHQADIHDDLAKLFWQEQSKAFQTKEKGMKWHPMMIRLALLIHSRGPAVYKTLRDTGVLKLPGETTLRDYTNYVQPQTGFNPEVVSEIQTAAEKLPEEQRFVVLLHDEMSIKEDLVWDSKTGKLVGFVNLQQWGERPDIFNHVASHVLVFYVVGVNSSLKYSLGYFDTRSATADGIYPLFWMAVGLLEMTCKLKIIASTSDKASPNQRLYQIHGQADTICYKTTNLFAPSRQIYFFSDVPHLMKTVRNNLFRSGPGQTMLLWYNGKELLWAHIRRVLEEDHRQ